MNVYEASLSAISTIIGGGIVGLPFAFFNLGFIAGFIIEVIFAYLTRLSCQIYLAAYELIPGKLDSLYEIGYMIFGRKSIFMISFIIAINSFGLMMIYFIIFAKIS
jgi:amino acid permease